MPQRELDKENGYDSPPTVNITIDTQHVAAPKTIMTGSELRALHNPPIAAERHLFLEADFTAENRTIGHSQQMELNDGMRFYSAPVDRTGFLSEWDLLWLHPGGYNWSATPDDARGGYLVIKDYPLAQGRFDHVETDLLLPIKGGHMWWVSPAIRSAASRVYPPAADHFEQHQGRTWQRVSRILRMLWGALIREIGRLIEPVAGERE